MPGAHRGTSPPAGLATRRAVRTEPGPFLLTERLRDAGNRTLLRAEQDVASHNQGGDAQDR
jgi:hypothetical protein